MSPKKKTTSKPAAKRATIRLLDKPRRPGRPSKRLEEKVRRIAVYVSPAAYEILERRSAKLGQKIERYAKRALEKLAAGLETEKA